MVGTHLLSLAGCAALLLRAAAASQGGEDEVSLLSTQVQVHRRASSGGPGLPLLQEGAGAVRRVRAVPAIEIDLDLPPIERWQWYYRANREQIIRDKAETLAKGAEQTANTTWLDDIGLTGFEDLVDELRGIVIAMDHPNVTLNILLWGEFSYERGETLGCTAVLAANEHGSVFHGRNLDLPDGSEAVPDLLDVTFTRGGRPVIVSTSFLGTVGVSTGYRVGSYSVAQNTRHSVTDHESNHRAAREGGHIFTLVVRKMLEEVPDFATAVQTMATAGLIAPQYFTLAGPGPYEGALITRDRRGSPEPYGNVQVLSPQIGRWFIVQTNDDISQSPNDARRPAAIVRLEQMQREDIDQDRVLSIMMTVPVLNLGTVFTWVFEPATGTRRMLIGEDELRADIAKVVKLPPFVLDW